MMTAARARGLVLVAQVGIVVVVGVVVAIVVVVGAMGAMGVRRMTAVVIAAARAASGVMVADAAGSEAANLAHDRRPVGPAVVLRVLLARRRAQAQAGPRAQRQRHPRQVLRLRLQSLKSARCMGM